MKRNRHMESSESEQSTVYRLPFTVYPEKRCKRFALSLEPYALRRECNEQTN